QRKDLERRPTLVPTDVTAAAEQRVGGRRVGALDALPALSRVGREFVLRRIQAVDPVDRHRTYVARARLDRGDHEGVGVGRLQFGVEVLRRRSLNLRVE